MSFAGTWLRVITWQDCVSDAPLSTTFDKNGGADPLIVQQIASFVALLATRSEPPMTLQQRGFSRIISGDTTARQSGMKRRFPHLTVEAPLSRPGGASGRSWFRFAVAFAEFLADNTK